MALLAQLAEAFIGNVDEINVEVKPFSVYTPSIRKQNDKDYIFCVWRRKFVRLTPEEWVRQNFLHALVEQGFPEEKIAVEAPIEVADLKKRCDAIVYDNTLRPVCIIEFKAPTVSLTQHVFDQVSVYNRRLHVAYFILSNGKEHQACEVSPTGYVHLPSLPSYQQLCQTR